MVEQGDECFSSQQRLESHHMLILLANSLQKRTTWKQYANLNAPSGKLT
jgi:hypothetical protein